MKPFQAQHLVPRLPYGRFWLQGLDLGAQLGIRDEPGRDGLSQPRSPQGIPGKITL